MRENIPSSLDKQDTAILTLLQRDSSLSMAELAEQVGLSLSPCWRRVKRMKDEGIIKSEVALIDRQAVGLEIDAVANVSLRHQDKDDRETFQTWVAKTPEVVECLSLSGERDYLVRILVPDLASYEHLLTSELLALPCVASVSTSFVLKEIKKTTALPL